MNSSRITNRAIKGLLLVDKPSGISSYGVVDVIKRRTGVKKVGHGGTLDPFATGLLVVLVGRAYTKRQSEFMQGRKVYDVVVTLGKRTETGDPTGMVVEEYNGPLPSRQDVEDVLGKFVGEVMQRPHPYSAVKYKGKPLYHYTRRGISVPIEPRPVHLYSIEFIELSGRDLVLRLEVSGGFYVRSFVEDLGEALTVPAMTRALRRLQVGRFHVKDAVDLNVIRSNSTDELAGIMKEV